MTNLRPPSLTRHDRRRFLHTATLATAATWLGGVRSRAGTLPEAEIASLRNFMAGELATPPYPIPGVVVMMGTPEETLFHEAVGLAQVTPREIPMRTDTIFDIASVTKVVATATACALCVDRGLLDPDAPIFTEEGARRLVNMPPNPERLFRMEVLADKANEGTLSDGERGEYESLVCTAKLLSILRMKAETFISNIKAA